MPHYIPNNYSQYSQNFQPITDSPVKEQTNERPPCGRARQWSRSSTGRDRAGSVTTSTPRGHAAGSLLCPLQGFPRHRRENGGDRVRTDDPLLAKQVLFQLSYAPVRTNLPRGQFGGTACRGSSGHPCKFTRMGPNRGSLLRSDRLTAPSGGFSFPPAAAMKMGQGGLEPPTPRLSSVCSNQLSYWPPAFGQTPKSNREDHQRQPKARSLTHLEKDAWTAPAPRNAGPGILSSPGQPSLGKECPNPDQPHPGPGQGRVHYRRLVFVRNARSLDAETPNPTASSLKGGDPAAGSPTATLLRLHPSH
jgi:hypothetical protein